MSADSSFSSMTPEQKQLEIALKKKIFQSKTSVDFKSLKKFSASFWIICGLAVLEKMTNQPFI